MPKRVRRAVAKISEHSRQVTLLQFLAINHAPDVFWFAVPNAGRRSWWEVAQKKKEGMVAGVADLCVMLPEGRALWLELKTGKNKQTEAQLAFQGICGKLGHPYEIARTLEEAIDSLSAWGALKKGWKL